MVMNARFTKVTGIIVSNRLQLTGLMIQGTGQQLGDIDGLNEVKHKVLSLEVLAKLGFKNHQLEVTPTGKIAIISQTFKLNKLDSFMVTNNGLFMFDSSIVLTKRYTVKGKTVGFDAEIDSLNFKKPLKIEQLIYLSSYMNNANYRVVNYDNGTKAVALKFGELPIQELSATRKKKAVNKVVETPKVESVKQVKEEVDIIDLFDFLAQSDSFIVKLPENNYVATNKKKVEIGDGFQALNIGEVADPYLTFPVSKMNANARFKKPGIVAVDGMPMPLFSYTHTEKHLFYNGKSHIGKLGILLKKEATANLNSYFGNNLEFTEITDKNRIKPLANITGNKLENVSMFEINTANLKFLAKDKNFLLSNKEIKDLQIELYKLELQAKLVSSRGKLVKEAAAKLTDKEKEKISGKELFAMFKGMDESALESIKEAGISLYTGEYLIRTAIASSDGTASETKSSDEKLDIEVSYTVSGYNSKSLTYDKILKLYDENISKLPRDVVILINTLLCFKTDYDKVKFCYKKSKELDKKIYQIRRKLWLHKCQMIVLGNGKMHQHDKKLWVNIPTKKKTGIDYQCKETGCEDLIITCINTSIK